MSDAMKESGKTEAHIGDVLRIAREQASLSLQDIAKQLHIQPKYLAAIEKLDIESLPSMGYVLGFIRSYALHLGLDAKKAVAQYKIDIECPEKLGMRDRPHFVPKRKIRLPRGSFAAGTVLSCLAVTVTWYGMKTDAQSAQNVRPETVQAENWGFEPVMPTKGDPDLVSLLAVGPSWVHVESDEGLVLTSRIMVPGEIFETKKQNMPTVSLRDAGAIELYLGGVRVGPLGEKGEPLKNLILVPVEQ